MNLVQRSLLKLKPVQVFIDWTKTTVVPAFSPLPIYTIATFFFKEISKESLTTKASALAYNFMLAIFPGLIFLLTLIPYIHIGNFQGTLEALIALILPENAYLAVETTLKEIINKQNGSLLSFGFITAVFFATNGVSRLMEAFNKSSLNVETRGWFKLRVVALVLTVVIVFALLLGIGIITLGEYLFSVIQTELHFENPLWLYLVDMGRWLILIAIYFITLSILYRYGPAHTKKWRLFSAGAWLATILAVFTFWGFSFYINNFSSYNKIYGSIGTLIVIMIWLYLNSLIILIGFELNASIDLSKRSIRVVKPQFNSFKEPVQEVLEKKLLQ
ncbi:MAG: YihY/virulence factor BrkB family protein [Sphingobacteriaceae bacterium]|jgi:membrane protein|nr:YihY/virulence factor BrkB family protein [Sphingobacteriaceae bacterium]